MRNRFNDRDKDERNYSPRGNREAERFRMGRQIQQSGSPGWRDYQNLEETDWYKLDQPDYSSYRSQESAGRPDQDFTPEYEQRDPYTRRGSMRSGSANFRDFGQRNRNLSEGETFAQVQQDWRPESGQRGRFGESSFGEFGKIGRYSGRGPKGYRRSDDRIIEDINERLTVHPDLDASDIEVQSTNGEVILSGTVEDRQSKRIAEDIAESVSGVKEVQVQIRIKKNQMQFNESESNQNNAQFSGTGTSFGQSSGKETTNQSLSKHTNKDK